MKKSYPSILINICLFLAGVLFLLFFNNDNVLKIVAIILGIIFIVPSLIYLGMVVSHHNEERDATKLMGIFPAIGGLCFGVVLDLKPELFSEILSVIFSVLLIALGLFHIVFMVMSTRRLKFKFWHYIIPLLIIISGVVTLLVTKGNLSLLILLTGISLILASFSTLIEYLAERKVQKAAKRVEAAAGGSSTASVPAAAPGSTQESDAVQQ